MLDIDGLVWRLRQLGAPKVGDSEKELGLGVIKMSEHLLERCLVINKSI